MFRALKAGALLALVATVACPSPAPPAAPILSGTYDDTDGDTIAHISFPDSTQYELVRNPPCDPTGANECQETGTFVYDAASGDLSLTSDDTGQTTVLSIEVQHATAPSATQALQTLGSRLAKDAGTLTTGSTSLVCPATPATVEGFRACPKAKSKGGGGEDAGGAGCGNFTPNPLQMPPDVVKFLTQNDWGTRHLEWHTVRQWDLMVKEKDQADITQAENEKPPWTRAPIQEGEVGNGFEFLMMHRAMLITLRKLFPCADFTGWGGPPTNANDPSYPVPKTNDDRTKTFSTIMKKSIANLESSEFLKQSFTGSNADDLYGLYVETSLRWVSETNPSGSPTDSTIGMHNYVHNRFSDCGATGKCTPGPIDMGDPSKNLKNQIFWKHHGWIDDIWSAVREANNESDTDPSYQAALQKELSMFETSMKSTDSLVLRNPRTEGAASFVQQQQAVNWGPRQ